MTAKRTYKLIHPVSVDGVEVTQITVFNRFSKVGTYRKALATIRKDPADGELQLAMMAQCTDVDQSVLDELEWDDMAALSKLAEQFRAETEGKPESPASAKS